MHDTEDKAWWVEEGRRLEDWFVEEIAPLCGLSARINPEKETNVYAPDLIVNNKLTDLKVQTTPFFTSARYGMDPGTTVTFNRKDYERYTRKYPKIRVIFLVRWDLLQWGNIRLEPLYGVWAITLPRIAKLIEQVPYHLYERRKEDTEGNAKGSYLLPLSAMQCLRLFEGDL